MKKRFISGLIAILFLVACSEDDVNSNEDQNTETNGESTEEIDLNHELTISSDEFVGAGEARLGDTYEQFVEAFGEDTSDTEGIGFFQDESIWMNYNDSLVFTAVLHFEVTSQVERSKEEITDLIEAFLPEDAKFEREEIDEEIHMLHYTSDHIAEVFESVGYSNENLDYREVRADLVRSDDNNDLFVGVVISSH